MLHASRAEQLRQLEYEWLTLQALLERHPKWGPLLRELRGLPPEEGQVEEPALSLPPAVSR
ncbi:hypothetical protein [Deinococcus peraridilitoris]|uniref:Uncharacterized protein n=1 Tax=Deinococcus peraridilitoris (strain DSM 19664 / LMG 22246 / CIP 109416 / KR-200) TaxID=937777 RepID=K9ZXZ2_DEIPD|nr:hypothetical protein [Deinococcus peraridilitoris]AFZ65792.1 hypothetical protein Deipe_0189 [Deinococcus peraridilitoris DSM 19664]